MLNLANALAIAVSYIDRRSNSDADDDIRAIEAIAAELQLSTDEEKEVLKEALGRLGRHDLKEGLGLE